MATKTKSNEWKPVKVFQGVNFSCGCMFEIKQGGAENVVPCFVHANDRDTVREKAMLALAASDFDDCVSFALNHEGL